MMKDAIVKNKINTGYLIIAIFIIKNPFRESRMYNVFPSSLVATSTILAPTIFNYYSPIVYNRNSFPLII